MSQEEIAEFLKERAGNWHTARDISSELDISLISARMNLKRLKQNGAIDHQRSTMRGNPYEYSWILSAKSQKKKR